ncbi:hypothetical protein GF362_05890 [Candidatus Dojkabacteria bacterium]|nr:hypothetical protein [Candidatus Dojkabacteria bacterium]
MKSQEATSQVVSFYRQSISQNLKIIKKILKTFEIDDEPITTTSQDILTDSSKLISSKWLEERKYLRSNFILEGFGELYPTSILQLSVNIDAMINILDDLLDENINNEIKTLYIFEFLRIFSIYSYKSKKIEINDLMGNYINKLITLAVSESYYLKQIKNNLDLEYVMQASIKTLTLRSLDIDVFVELVMQTLGIYDKNEFNIIRMSSRLFRAVNILKKDIDDIDYDIKNEQETLVTYIKLTSKFNYCDYVTNLCEYYIKQMDNLSEKYNSKNKRVILPIKNFQHMLNKDIKIIKNSI